jgi:hypothetical protein
MIWWIATRTVADQNYLTYRGGSGHGYVNVRYHRAKVPNLQNQGRNLS